MIIKDKLYQSILNKLSIAPIEVLRLIDAYLKKYTSIEEERQKNKQKTLALAGGWAEMSDEETIDFLDIEKESSHADF